jgi:hypothetical protein
MSQGYPDWQRVETRTGEPLLRWEGQDVPAQVTEGPFYVGNWPELMVYAAQNIGPSSVVDILDLASGDVNDVITLTEYVFTPGLFLNVQRPINTQYIGLRVRPITAGDSNWDLALVPTTNEHSQSPILTKRVLYNVTNQNVAAGATLTVPLDFIAPGPATFHFQGPTTYNNNLQFMDTGGNWQSLYPYTGTDMGGTYTDRIVLPESAIRFTFHNTDGAAMHQYNASLVRE